VSVVFVALQARLSSQQRRFLLDQGYLVVRSLLDPGCSRADQGRLEELVRQTVAAWADDPSLDTTEACVVASFEVADPDFGPCHQHPLLAATLVLGGTWYVHDLACRRPSPGRVSRGCNRTSPNAGPRGRGRRWRRCGCGTPFTRDSGRLRVIPGSHCRAEPPINTEHGYAAGMAPHPDEVKIIAPEGSVVLFNSAGL
jgi:hypothetical protein